MLISWTYLSYPIEIAFTAVCDKNIPAVETDQVSGVTCVALDIRHVELSAGARVNDESGGWKVQQTSYYWVSKQQIIRDLYKDSDI